MSGLVTNKDYTVTTCEDLKEIFGNGNFFANFPKILDKNYEYVRNFWEKLRFSVGT